MDELLRELADLRRRLAEAETLAAPEDVRLERARSEEALRAAHDTFRHLVEHSPFGVYAVNADFRLVLVSAGAQKVFENVRPLIGRDFAEVLRTIWEEPFATEAIGRFRHTLATGEPFHAPSTIEHRHDVPVVEAYDWKIERLALPDGRLGVVCHFYDLSERQAYEAALREADRQKDEFLAMLAHELRNPLAPIRTSVGILRERGSSDPVIARCRDVIDRQAAQMARLLDDLLDISRLSRGRLTLRRVTVALDEVLDAAVETSRPGIDQHGHELRVSNRCPGVLLDGDEARLTQVFANLLNNAAKYSPPGARIDLLAVEEGGEAVVRVRDTGIGMTPDLLERVFGLFSRGADAQAQAPGGLGIGLSLARRLVEMHGGTIAAASAGPGQGSEFTVRLPTLAAHPADAVPGAGIPRGAAVPIGCRVLVVDDNVDAANMTAMLLQGVGCETRTVYDGPAALREAEAFRPAVVLLDVGMPVMDGHEVCRRIRRETWGRDQVIVAISGWGQEEARQRSADAGFDQHLAKPVDPDVLVGLIRDAATRAAGRTMPGI